MTVIPARLQPGDLVQVIAPARSMNILSDEIIKIAVSNLEKLGFKVSFGKHVYEINKFKSSSIESRIKDIHEAFLNPKVKGILTAIGGFNSNQLLQYIDWNIIKENPKIFCGYSDITALSNAFFTKTGLITYSGMHFSTFGQRKLQSYNTDYFKKCLMATEPFAVTPSKLWSDDEWYLNQENRNLTKTNGWWVINPGTAEGTSIGGNLSTLRLLFGTEYMPELSNSVLFIEDDNYTENDVLEFDRNLQSLIHRPNFEQVKALIIGRFQIGSGMTKELLTKITTTKPELKKIPVLANVDFGHTDPLFTFPIGGYAQVIGESKSPKIIFQEH